MTGSFDHFKDQSAIQFLSIFCRNSSLIIAHEEIACKTNEIPVAQKLITELDIEHAVYTCDALSCQIKTLDVVKDTGSDIIVQVKNNQKSLLEDCIAIADSSSYIEKDQEAYVKAHGRIESRTATIFSPEGLSEKWSKVESIIKIERERMIFNTQSKEWEDKGETSYYISTNLFSAKESNSAIRGHWGIENKNHHVKDATMKEDFSRIRINPQNIARLRSFALNIMRYNKVGNINAELYSNVLDFGNLLKYGGL
jgi:predicted transposase YbfD/YdcC